MKFKTDKQLILALLPIIFLLVSFAYLIVTKGAEAVSKSSQYILITASLIAFCIGNIYLPFKWKNIGNGIRKSAIQILPAIPVLVLIAMVASTWMLGGIVPSLIYYGLSFLNQETFLAVTCIVCSIISVLTGSSWTTCATIGLAFMGIGTLMGFEQAWIAGAVISGAYFGDKVSPLSDTTVLAASTTGVKMFDHIKNLMTTTVPAMTIALTAFVILGFSIDGRSNEDNNQLINDLSNIFSINWFLMLAPVITCILIIARVNVLTTLATSSLLGVAGMFFTQEKVLCLLNGSQIDSVSEAFNAVTTTLFRSTSIDTGNPILNDLVATGGVEGIIGTLFLIISAMLFGGMMMGTGMLGIITSKALGNLQKRSSIVPATVGTGLFMNSCSGDQYLSIIVTGNLFIGLYEKNNLPPKLLGRSLEDSISVTSVLIPWNSCGMTQSTVLGVATISYLPFCIFNYLCPIMSILIATIGHKIKIFKKS